MPNPTDTFLSGSNIDFIEGLYARWLEDPTSVDASWRELFAGTTPTGRPLLGSGDGRAQPTNGHAAANGAIGEGGERQRGADRGPGARGHTGPGGLGRATCRRHSPRCSSRRGWTRRCTPSGSAATCSRRSTRSAGPRPQMNHIADLAMASDAAFSPEELEQVVDTSEVFPDRKRVKLRELLARLRRTYCGHVGVEYMNVLDSSRRRWLMPRMEHTENQLDPEPVRAAANPREADLRRHLRGVHPHQVPGRQALQRGRRRVAAPDAGHHARAGRRAGASRRSSSAWPTAAG